MTQKVLQVGSSAGVTISKESLKSLGLKVGDQVVVTLDDEQKSIMIAPAKTNRRHTESVVRWTDEFIRRYRPALEALSRK